MDNYAEFIHYRTPLTHTRRKLQNGEEIRVVFFGGSVTAGYGSSNGETRSWRGLTCTWMKERFPQASFRMIPTPIGESGTYLGVYRLQTDVIAQKPDLLFIEYAINDKYKGADVQTAALQYETIVREVRQALPLCDIVTVLVTDRSAAERLPDLYPAAAGHERIAAAYGISTLNVGGALMRDIGGFDKWDTYILDIVHPRDAGYEFYSRPVIEYLEHALFDAIADPDDTPKPLPLLQSKHLLDGDRRSLFGRQMDDAVTNADGFAFCDELYYGPSLTPHNGYYVAKEGEEASLTLRFYGTELAIWTSFYNTSSITLSVDGGAVQTLSCDRHAPTTLVRDLSSGEHTLCLSPVIYGPETDDKMKIGGIFIRDAAKQTVRV